MHATAKRRVQQKQIQQKLLFFVIENHFSKIEFTKKIKKIVIRKKIGMKIVPKFVIETLKKIIHFFDFSA